MPMWSLRLSPELAARVDEAAGGNRSAWIKGALEQALSGRDQEPAGSAVASSRVEAASARASAISDGSGIGLAQDRAAAFRRAEVLRRAGN